MIDITQIQSDRQAIIAEIPTTITIGAKTYQGRRSNNMKTKKYSENGGVPGYKMSISLYTSDVFANDTKATIGTVNYRILDIDVGAVDGLQTLHLGSEFQ